MLSWISKQLYRVSKGWLTLGATIVFVLFVALALPGQSTGAESEAGKVGSPDLSLTYSADSLYRMAEGYGEQGRGEYVRARFTFDLVWPVVYTLFLSTAISWLYSGTFALDSRWRWANLAPVSSALFDYLENLSTSLVMSRYPARTPVVDSAAGAFTLVKWVLVGASFVLLLVGVTVTLWRWVRKRAWRGHRV
jgi:hypothetical protein